MSPNQRDASRADPSTESSTSLLSPLLSPAQRRLRPLLPLAHSDISVAKTPATLYQKTQAPLHRVLRQPLRNDGPETNFSLRSRKTTHRYLKQRTQLHSTIQRAFVTTALQSRQRLRACPRCR